jgi:hypothetical protein
MNKRRLGSAARVGLFASSFVLGSCYETVGEVEDLQTFRVRLISVNDADPPSKESPLDPNTGERDDSFEIEVEAVGGSGELKDFDGYVRVTIEPGSVVSVVDLEDNSSEGRNLRLRGGKGKARILATASYGPTRIEVEDLGYLPAPEGETPACANGKNDDPDDDVAVDYPNDTGCQFADDNSETGGTYSAGVSPTIYYELPSIQDVQGTGSTTPYAFESITINTSGEHEVIVTRIAKDGFYATDLSGQDAGFNHMFAFSFSTPRNLRVCDRLTLLSGTVSEFFGFTEMNFPSYESIGLVKGDEDKCRVPAPVVLDPETIIDPNAMEALESGLVRIEGYHVSGKMGPGLALGGMFGANATNCDFNGDGRIDFESDAEGSCGNLCSDDPECTEWTSFVARGNYKVAKQVMSGMSVIQVQTDGAPEFSPVANRGATLTSLTGTLRNFSGGNLNWTIDARCTADLVCQEEGCSKEVSTSKQACVDLRTEDDNDEGSN